MKHEHKIIILISIFVLLVASITFTHVFIHYRETGSFNVVKNYYEVFITNPTISDSDMTIKVNNDENFVHVEIPDLKEKETIEFSYDLLNIGNTDIITNSYTLTNVMTNINMEDVIISSSIDKDEVIRGSESKKAILKIKYIGKNNEEKPYLNFNINYSFNELTL